MPLKPQPTPKVAAPASSSLSIRRRSGKSTGAPSRLRRLSAHDPERRRGREHGGPHDDGELRPPLAEDVEKAEYVGGVRHAGDEKASAEQQAREQRREEFHGAPAWRTTNTVSTAADMKTSVATSERVDRFARPQTPCPLVQPAPICVPAPTSSPDIAAKAQ